MPTCTFFGHRDSPETIKPALRAALIDLIENKHVDRFFIGQQGAFDRMAYAVLTELQAVHPHIHYAIVLDRLIKKQPGHLPPDVFHVILPEGIEFVPPRFAISWRNRWMLERSDYVVTYVTHSWGGAARFAALANAKGKIVISLYCPVAIPS